MKYISALFLIAAFTAVSGAQNSRPESGLDGNRWGVVYDVAATKKVRLTHNVPYSGSLTIDIYSPPEAKPTDKRPAIVFLNAIGDGPEGKVKDWGIYRSWPRLMAAQGMIGISMDADRQHI